MSDLLRCSLTVFGRPLQVTVRSMLIGDHCLVCPVCNVIVYCGQTVGWINRPLGTAVGVGSGVSVLDGWEPSSPGMEKGTVAPPPTFRPMSIVAKRWPISATAEPLLLIVSSYSVFKPQGC